MISSTNVTKTVLTAAAVLCTGVLSADEFPYRAQVTNPGAKVFAGPGSHYYDTAELPVGAEVEVYEHTPSGLCAVRPPKGSFCWLPASAVRMLQGDIGEVTRDQAPARVGSLLHERRDAVHVRLSLGERVRVLSDRDIDGVRWLQIAPPSGEFRWMQSSSLKPIGHTGAESRTGDSQESGWVRAAGHTEQPSEAAGEASPQPSAEVVDAKPIASNSNNEKPGNAKPIVQSQPPADAIPLTGDFAQRLSALEVNLARQVAELPTLWILDPIEQQAAQLMRMAQTEQQRQAVRVFAARVDRFATIAGQYKTMRGAAPQVALTKITKLNPQTPATPLGGYDAVGTLRPVVSKRAGAPQFALVDDQGKILSFVTAPTEMNLNHLLGVRVGVQGAKGFMPEYQQPHLTAGRVTQLGGMLR